MWGGSLVMPSPPPFSLQVVQTPIERAIREDRAFRAFYHLVLPQAATSYVVGITGTRNIFMTRRSIYTDGGGLLFSVLERPTVTGIGTPVPTFNVDRNRTETSTFLLQDSQLQVSAGTLIDQVHVLGGGAYALPNQIEVVWILKRNSKYAAQIENVGRSVANISISWYWYEEEP